MPQRGRKTNEKPDADGQVDGGRAGSPHESQDPEQAPAIGEQPPVGPVVPPGARPVEMSANDPMIEVVTTRAFDQYNDAERLFVRRDDERWKVLLSWDYVREVTEDADR